MSVVKLRLDVDLLAKLYPIEDSQRVNKFVRIKTVVLKGGHFQVDLDILDTFNDVLVTREMVDALFDILGIFPRVEGGVTGPTWPK